MAERKTSVNLKIQVLKNLQMYLQEEDSRMQEADRECECLFLSSFGAADLTLFLTVDLLYFNHLTACC